ncbi:MauE/DoxX family redox-associated membrane protein [Actinoallomurus sp. CA-150999]|uniref:MauE/DoxX family redox-associated membrane protein n=1 Tax=Actinoallomurus sp. CA-150999 TaxID=3239887 RepID=UPI003D8F3C2E
MEYVRAACASLIALVFVASAVSKLRDFGGFERSLPGLAPVARLARPPARAVVAAAIGRAAPGGLPVTAGLAIAVAGGLVGAILIVALDDIVDLFARSS